MVPTFGGMVGPVSRVDGGGVDMATPLGGVVVADGWVVIGAVVTVCVGEDGGAVFGEAEGAVVGGNAVLGAAVEGGVVVGGVTPGVIEGASDGAVVGAEVAFDTGDVGICATALAILLGAEPLADAFATLGMFCVVCTSV